MTKIIVACERGFGIGKNGVIPFFSDMSFFKETTMGGVVIMGRKTWESLKERPLPGRINVIVSTDYDDGRWRLEKNGEPFYVFRTLEKAIHFAQSEYPRKNHFNIGGAKLYDYALSKPGLVTSVIMSKIGVEAECDTFFPLNRDQLEERFGRPKVLSIDNEGIEPVIRLEYGSNGN